MKIVTYDISELRATKKIEVKFRRGKDEIIEIYHSNNYQKLFKIIKKLIAKQEDLNRLFLFFKAA